MARALSAPGVAFTHPEKMFFPAAGFRKADLIEYYLAAAPVLLPHLRRRPVTLIRYPDGVEGEHFYEKNAPKFAPRWLKTVPVSRRAHEGAIDYIVIDDVRTLAWCANLAAIELHPFLHRVTDLDRPTVVAFDLDPGETVDILGCAEVAFLLRELMTGLGLDCFAKASGSKGIQIYVPLNTAVSYQATGAFAHAVADLLVQRHPDRIVSNMSKAVRKGKVLIDWSQNSGSKTTVCAYSLRAKREEPFASAPVKWEELKRAKTPAALFFSPKAALARAKKLGDLFEPVLKLKQKLPKEFSGALPEPARSRPRANTSKTLAEYRRKRDFSRTAEPAPAPARGGTRGAGEARAEQAFVIQKHAASHLHYDFRLEMDGTLKSWAVPKGLPYVPGVKRSGFQVEDHPLDYLRFEGTIPAGQYGGGTVMVWDIGTYRITRGDYAKGSLHLELKGKKLKGAWHIFRIRSDERRPVWLIEKEGTPMKALTPRQDDASALTRRSMERIAKDNDAQWT